MISDTIAGHRSIRKFKPESVKAELLTEILEAGTRASNTGNMQVYSIIVTRDEALRKELAPIHFNQKMVLEAPVHITFCADVNRFSLWCRQRDAEPGYNNLLWFVSAAIDTVLASQNVALAAEERGLGICYLGTVAYNPQPLINLLHLPHGVIPVTAMVMGHPDVHPPLTPRLPLDGVVHYETYTQYTPAHIDAIYAHTEASELTQSLLDLNKKSTLAQVFTQNRYTLKDNLAASEAYLLALKKQGFL